MSYLGARAHLVDHWRTMIVAARGPAEDLISWTESQLEREPRRTGEIVAAILTPNLNEAVLKLHARDAERQLALAALQLRLAGSRSGTYPGFDSLPERLRRPTRYRGERIIMTPLENGGLEVALPQTLEDANARWAQQFWSPRLRWLLPPVGDVSPAW